MKRLGTTSLASVILATLAACATTTSPTGRTQYVGAVSDAQLDQMGLEAFAETKASKAQSTDKKQVAYIRCVVDDLVRELPAESRNIGWETAVFVDKEPNAFALPGGKVGVYTGILTVARNQDELAAVLGHEIGHVIAHHHSERLTRQAGTQAGLGVLSSVLGARYGGAASDATSQLGGLAAQGLVLLPNSRVQESEADVVGQQLMARAGFDPHAAINLWENMIAAGGSRPPQWLSTHPDPQSRIAELGKRADGLMPDYQHARETGRQPHCTQ